MSSAQLEARASLPDRRVMLAFAVSTLLAGANAVAVRFTVAELSPFWGAGMRFTGAGVIFVLMALLRRRPMPTRSEMKASALYGVIGFGTAYALLYWGLQTVQAGMAQVILALTPLLTLLFAVLHRLERFRWRGLIGALIAVGGIGIAFYDGDSAPLSLLPVLAVVAGAACFAESSIVLKRLQTPDPVVANAIGMTTGAIMLLTLSVLNGETWALPRLASTWLSVIYLVIVGSVVVFYMIVFVLGHWSASASSYQLVLMPFVTISLGAWLLGEKIGSGLLVGGTLVLIGVWVGAFSGSQRAPAQPPIEALPAEGD